MKNDKSITEILEETKAEMCDKYCKYPYEPIPEGRDDDWMFNDICPNCPLNRL